MKEILRLKIITNARKNEIVGRMDDGTIKIRLKAKPIGGKANAMLIDFLSGLLHLQRDKVMIIAGERSPWKTVQIEGLDRPIDWE